MLEDIDNLHIATILTLGYRKLNKGKKYYNYYKLFVSGIPSSLE